MEISYHRALADLVEHLHKNSPLCDLTRATAPDLLEMALRKIGELKMEVSQAREIMRFCEEIRVKNTPEELKVNTITMQDCKEYQQVIDYIVDLKINIIGLADLFITAAEAPLTTMQVLALTSLIAQTISNAQPKQTSHKPKPLKILKENITGLLKDKETIQKALSQIRQGMEARIRDVEENHQQTKNNFKVLQAELKQCKIALDNKNEQIAGMSAQLQQYRLQTTMLEASTEDQEVQTNLQQLISTEVQASPQPMSIQHQVQTESIQSLQQEFEIIFKRKYRLQTLFQGQIFVEDVFHKERLVRHIEEAGGRRIQRTRRLYRYDPLNQVNFHRYIDNVEGLAFIVKAANGAILAGYYSGKLVPDKILNEFGLLVCLNQDERYLLAEPENGKVNRGMVYDDYYVIFGNSELRVKNGEDFLFSNFGIANAYFNNRGRKIADFLGDGGNREIKFQIYEFYQVVLEAV